MARVDSRWLSIVGIGEDGIEGLSTAALHAVQAAEVVFGGTRHLTLAASQIRGVAHAWQVPFDPSMTQVLARRGRPVCVLASGDPFQHGVGSVLARHVSCDETSVYPAPSAFSLAAARLLWSLSDTILLSLCGHPVDLLQPHLHPGARLLTLTSNANAAADIAQLLGASGFGASRLTVLEALGGPHERIRRARADSFDLDRIQALNVVAVEVAAGNDARVVALTTGRDDALFEHDGQMTKQGVRAMTLAALAPRRGERLWDVGAGSGSIAIEWLLADASLSACAIEARAERAARVRRNATAFGVPRLQIVEGTAPAALHGLAQPDAIFIGGGVTAPGMVDLAQESLRPQGRLVANAVTLEAEAVLLQQHARTGGSMTRVALSHASPIAGSNGRFAGWRPAMPITQWVWVKS
jgi:precorrin-6Y C5,15-methyltransferase (decarboxylating)